MFLFNYYCDFYQHFERNLCTTETDLPTAPPPFLLHALHFILTFTGINCTDQRELRDILEGNLVQKHQPLSRTIRLYISSEIAGKRWASHWVLLLLRILVSQILSGRESTWDNMCSPGWGNTALLWIYTLMQSTFTTVSLWMPIAVRKCINLRPRACCNLLLRKWSCVNTHQLDSRLW